MTPSPLGTPPEIRLSRWWQIVRELWTATCRQTQPTQLSKTTIVLALPLRRQMCLLPWKPRCDSIYIYIYIVTALVKREEERAIQQSERCIMQFEGDIWWNALLTLRTKGLRERERALSFFPIMEVVELTNNKSRLMQVAFTLWSLSLWSNFLSYCWWSPQPNQSPSHSLITTEVLPLITITILAVRSYFGMPGVAPQCFQPQFSLHQ